MDKPLERNQDAIDQARAQYASIAEMVEALQAAEQSEDDRNGCAADDARQVILEDALSVQVRTGWYTPGTEREKPAEYEILLCTGGPAVRIIGELSEHGEPETAQIQWQDWGTPWTRLTGQLEAHQETMLAYARCFWFGE